MLSYLAIADEGPATEAVLSTPEDTQIFEPALGKDDGDVIGSVEDDESLLFDAEKAEDTAIAPEIPDNGFEAEAIGEDTLLLPADEKVTEGQDSTDQPEQSFTKEEEETAQNGLSKYDDKEDSEVVPVIREGQQSQPELEPKDAQELKAELLGTIPNIDGEPESIAVGEIKTVSVESAGEKKYFAFTPETDGKYTFTEEGAISTVYIYLHDFLGNPIKREENSYTAYFYADSTYYFEVYFADYDTIATFDVRLYEEAFDNQLTAYPAGNVGSWYEEITARLGTTATLEVVVEANDMTDLTYTWYNHISSEQIREDTNTLTVPVHSDYSAYECVVSDQYKESVTVEFDVHGRALVSASDIPELNITDLALGETGAARIEKEGDIVYFAFACEEDGKYEFITSPSLARLELYYPIPNDSEGRIVQMDSGAVYWMETERLSTFDLMAKTTYYMAIYFDFEDSDVLTGDIALQIKKATSMSQTATPISVGETVTAELENRGDVACFSFTPETTGPYVFESDPYIDPDDVGYLICLYDEEEQELFNYVPMEAYLEAGSMYYFGVRLLYGSNQTLSFRLTASNQLKAWAESHAKTLAHTNESMVLSVGHSATDSSGITFAWTKEDSDTVLGTEAELSVVSSADEGVTDVYLCTVSDTYGNSETVRFAVMTIEYTIIGDGSVFTVELLVEEPGSYYQTLDFFFKPEITGCYEFTAALDNGGTAYRGELFALWPSKLREGNTYGKQIYDRDGGEMPDQGVVRDVLQAGTGYCFEIMTDSDEPVTFSVRVFPQDACGEQATWTYADGTLTVSGHGATWYYSGIDYGWNGYSDEITKVVVEEGITDLTFALDTYHHPEVTEIDLPSSIKKISRIDCTTRQGLILRYAGTIEKWKTVDKTSSDLALATVLCNDGEVRSDSCGENATWAFDLETGTLAISGSGAIYDYQFTVDPSTGIATSDAPWKGLRWQIERVVLNEGITNVGSWALAGLENLDRLDLPVSLVEIPEWMLFRSPVRDIYFAGNAAQWRALNIQSHNANVINAAIHCQGQDVEMSSWAGPQADWNYDEATGTLTITGTGSTWDFNIEDGGNPPWYGVKDQVRAVVVESGITAVGYDSFTEMPNLEKVTLADSIERIGARAFVNAVSLTEIPFPANLLSIDVNAFCGCSALTEARLPDQLESIDAMAFAGCTNLKNVHLSAGVREIGEAAFLKSGLQTVYYSGTGAQWSSIIIRDNNEQLLNAKLVTSDDSGDGEQLFSDVSNPDDYYFVPVYWAKDKGITSGTSATTFSPAKECTRGQIVTFLWNAVGRPEPTDDYNPFTDVKETDYFYKPVLWAKEHGVTAGTSATTFSPGKACTRGQIVTFLWKALGSAELNDGRNPFGDIKETDYFYKPVLWAKENSITSGTSATTFSPGKACTRAQAMTFLYKAVE